MSECNRCTVPYAAHEAAHARQERANRRLWIVCIILIIALVATNVAWIMYETQYKTAVSEIYARHDGEGVNFDLSVQNVKRICYKQWDTVKKHVK